MGLTNSKSPLERRNTVARRSQRRTLHNLKAKVDNLLKDVKKFKGVSEDANYITIKNEIEYFKNDLNRRKKDLQPQVRQLYETVFKKVSEVEDALVSKLQENREKQEKMEAKQRVSSVDEDFSEMQGHTSEGQEVLDNETLVDVHAVDEDNRRKTVEINLVQVIPDDGENTTNSPKEVRIVSPADKRKSILKLGVAVMPGAVMNEFTTQTNKITHSYNGTSKPSSPIVPRTVQDVTTRINYIIDSLRQVEQDISEFVGQKNGTQYNKIRNFLNQYLIELSTISPVDDVALEQLVVCRNYIGSCLSFLDEKALALNNVTSRESFTSDDEVFDNNSVLPAMAKVEENFRLQKLLKNTAV